MGRLTSGPLARCRPPASATSWRTRCRDDAEQTLKAVINWAGFADPDIEVVGD